ncbi:hypothetical protein [Streptomyces sp. SAS_270]|uniref:hypothetical protein n=1 Tax=Streptomyces sp. SAS_270 TaxID=3412748 RepID=UPI00403C1C9C
MPARPLKAVCALAAAASLALTAAPAQAATDPDPRVWTDLSTTYQATSAYGYEPFAVAAGYARTNDCVANPPVGGMGYHYVKPKYIGSLDPAKPAAVLYEDRGDGKRRLVAVEWVVADTGQATPKLFGEKFQKNELPGHFTLHAWIYKSNPRGLFYSWNPRVTCPAA